MAKGGSEVDCGMWEQPEATMLMVQDNFWLNDAMAATETVPDWLELYVEYRGALFDEGGQQAVMAGGLLN